MKSRNKSSLLEKCLEVIYDRFARFKHRCHEDTEAAT